MKILFICHRFPFPPKRGGKIRPFNIIKHLAKQHEVVVASIVRTKNEAKEGMGLKKYCDHVYMGLITKSLALYNTLAKVPTNSPFSMGYFYSKEILQAVQEEISKTHFDLIFVHCSSVAQYVENVNGTPKILDFGDMDSQKWLLYSQYRKFPLNNIYHTEGLRLQRVEIELAKKFDYCTCTTLNEKKTLDSYETGARTEWFPNGVDAEYFRPCDDPYEPDTISFVGRMDYYPNQECMFDFCANVLPLIREKRQNVKLMIIGASPTKAVRNLAKIPGVSVTGSVEDVRPYLKRCAVNVAPLNIARGTQNKILEVMAMGIPVVASAHAAGGVDAIPQEHFLTASTHEEFADAIIQLLSDKKEHQRLAEAGRKRMLTNHNWDVSLEKLDAIIDDCINTSKNHE